MPSGEPTRREVLWGLVAALAACGLDLDLPADASYDEVLEALHATAATFGDGLANHGPMTIDALVALDLADDVVTFVNGYSGSLELRGEGTPIPEGERDVALGALDRLEDWNASYLEDVEELGIQPVLDRDWDRLVTGWMAAGWHGLLRVAHALRAVARAESAVRVREVALGLGFLASHHAELPGRPGADGTTSDLLVALRAVPRVPAGERVDRGLILDQLGPVVALPGFADAVEAVAIDDVESGITELCAASARMFLSAGGTSIVLLHAITGTSALRLVLPWLSGAQAATALGYAFQAVAAAWAATGASDDWTGEGDSVDEVVALAAGSADPHVVKLCEATIREYAVDPRPEFLAAARAWANGGVR